MPSLMQKKELRSKKHAIGLLIIQYKVRKRKKKVGRQQTVRFCSDAGEKKISIVIEINNNIFKTGIISRISSLP